MADKIEIVGKSDAQCALEMVHTILFNVEKKDLAKLTRVEYLQTVVQCVQALKGTAPTA